VPDKSILDEFAEFLAAKTQAERDNPDDFAVDLRDSDGNEVRGIPISQAKKFLEKFGLVEPEPPAEGEGDKGGKPKVSPIKEYFQGGKRAAGSQG
jgi:hypothetical protein